MKCPHCGNEVNSGGCKKENKDQDFALSASQPISKPVVEVNKRLERIKRVYQKNKEESK